jgi:hypothetical protein
VFDWLLVDVAPGVTVELNPESSVETELLDAPIVVLADPVPFNPARDWFGD